jgi:hypothetical protein
MPENATKIFYFTNRYKKRPKMEKKLLQFGTHKMFEWTGQNATSVINYVF